MQSLAYNLSNHLLPAIADDELPLEPEVPELPELPDEPEVPLFPELPLEPEVPLFPELPDEPEVPEFPSHDNQMNHLCLTILKYHLYLKNLNYH